MASLDGRKIGFIGLGLMGRPMSLNLQAAGAALTVYDVVAEAVAGQAARGMTAAASPAAAAAGAEVVIVMVSDTPSVEAVLFGEGGIVAALTPGTLVIDMGTTAVPATRRFAAAVAEMGSAYVDAPVSGGALGAEAGTLTVMAGGPDEAVARAMPFLEVLGTRITHVGATGAGQMARKTGYSAGRVTPLYWRKYLFCFSSNPEGQNPVFLFFPQFRPKSILGCIFFA